MTKHGSETSHADAARFLSLLARPGDVFELRGLSKGRSTPIVTAGYFDDMDQLARAALERSGKDDGVYITLNPCNPALLARAPANKVRQAGNGDTTSDRDVAQRRHLLVDVDPVRPTGISSNDDEHAASLVLSAQIADALAERGWPEPIRADSGNGGHLIYAIDLPTDDGGLVKRVLAELSRQFTSPTIKVDEKVFNPARISKLYGTLTKKGENTSDRPHRISRILSAPAYLEVVTREQLEALAPVASPPARKPSNGTAPQRSQFDLDAWIVQYLPDAVQQPWSEGRKWLLPVCPFNSDHARKEAYIAEKHGGMIAAGCQHESCFKSWRELRLKFEPDAYERRDHQPSTRNLPADPPPEVLYQDASYAPELDAETLAIAARDDEPETAAPKPTFQLISISEAYDELAALAKAPVFTTPFAALNNAIGFGGYLGTQVYTVAAGTGRGKTSFVGEQASHSAMVDDVPVIVSVHELGPGYFVARRAGGQLGLHSNEIIRGTSGRTREEIMRVLPREDRLMFLKRPTLVGLRDATDFVAQKYGKAPLLIVDYLQKLADEVAAKQARPDLRMATTEASDALVKIGEFTKAAILAVSSIGRGKKELKTPRKFVPYDLVEVAKESGAVEYDGAGLIVLTLSKEFDGDERVGTITLAKARFGREVHIDARYHGARGSWRALSEVEVDSDSSKKMPVTPPPPPAHEENRFDTVKEILVAELMRGGPAVNKTALLRRTKGVRRETAIDAYDALWIAGAIVKVGTGITLSEKGRQLALNEVEK